MTATLRFTLAVAATLAVLAIGWTTIQATRADALAYEDPAAALRIDPDHPEALLQLAREQMAARNYEAAKETARHLLAVEPGQGEGFAILALAAARHGDRDAARLLDAGLRRAPRNTALRAQAAAARLRAGNFPAAMQQIDALLRLGSSQDSVISAALLQQAQDPRFADAIAQTLAAGPSWRTQFLVNLSARGTPAAVDQVNAALQRRGSLSDPETARWLARMLKDGRWSQAYARWVDTFATPPDALPLVYDGGFEQEPSGIGFDWAEERVSGVTTQFESVPGAGGERAAHFRFIGIPAAGGAMVQPLLLAPGHYRLALRARAEFLQSDQGLQWTVRCADASLAGSLGPLEGSFEWQAFHADVVVPESGCPGQWLRLENPATKGAARQVSGDLWVDDVRIVRFPPQSP
jgi:tetratricopeptide (TPR) repeat protein